MSITLAVRAHKGCTAAGASAAVACCHNEGTVCYAGSGAHSSISSSAAAGTITHAKSVASHHSDARKHKRHWMDVKPQSWLLPLRRVRCIVMFSDLSSSAGRDLSGLRITLQLHCMRVRYSTAVLRVCYVWRRLATPTRCIWSAAQCRTAGLGRFLCLCHEELHCSDLNT